MTLLLVGYVMGYGRKLKTLFWFYFLTSCAIGALFVGTASAFNFQNYCGDGKVEETEECDDGNNDNGDGCDYNCHIEDPTTIVEEETEPTPTTRGSYSYRNVYKPKGGVSSSNVSDILPIFVDMVKNEEELKNYNDPNEYFSGNNYQLYKAVGNVLKDEEPTGQRTIMWKVMNGMDKVNQQILSTKYKLSKVGIVAMFDLLLDVQIGRKHFSVTKFLGMGNAVHSEMISYVTPRSNVPVVGKPIVFTLNDKTDVAHIDWHFGAGKTYGCDVGQCSAVPIVYSEARTYDIIVIIRYRDGSTNHEEISIDVMDEESYRDTSATSVTVKPGTRVGNVYRPMGAGEYAGDPITLKEDGDYILSVSPILSREGNMTHKAVYRLETNKDIAHLDWAFGNGKVHSCDRSDCKQVPVTYDKEGEYVVSLIIRWSDNKETRLESTVKIN